MNKIVFATNNKHKLSEIRQILKGKYHVLGLADIGFNGDIPETGDTLAENAFIKSQFVFDRFQVDCFSDDTGLEIDALGGRPGVYSARYAGEEGDAERNIHKILGELIGINDRSARFVTVISLILGDEQFLFEGRVEGQITNVKIGDGGFGYDPVFIPDGYDKTFAEIESELKNSISHRKRAVDKLIAFLNKT